MKNEWTKVKELSLGKCLNCSEMTAYWKDQIRSSRNVPGRPGSLPKLPGYRAEAIAHVGPEWGNPLDGILLAFQRENVINRKLCRSSYSTPKHVFCRFIQREAVVMRTVEGSRFCSVESWGEQYVLGIVTPQPLLLAQYPRSQGTWKKFLENGIKRCSF